MGLTGAEEEEKQNVAESTMMREAYFVDFALAMQDKVSIPLMVTGGFRRLAAMEQAVEGGGADLIGLGRPMCVMTDAPNRLLQGLAELPRYEEELSLFPRWLSFLEGVKALRSVAGFAVIFWYYAQLDLLGKTGQTAPDLSVFAAARKVMGLQKELLANRR